MSTLAQVRNYVDSRLADLWLNQIQPREDAYFLTHGRYWQGIVTTNVDLLPNNPDDANATVLEVVPDVLRKPTDQAESWQGASINLGASIPMALQVDVYDGPSGKGYVGIVYARWNDTIYTRAQNSGPEAWRTHPWRVDQARTDVLRALLEPVTPGLLARTMTRIRSWFA